MKEAELIEHVVKHTVHYADKMLKEKQSALDLVSATNSNNIELNALLEQKHQELEADYAQLLSKYEDFDGTLKEKISAFAKEKLDVQTEYNELHKLYTNKIDESISLTNSFVNSTKKCMELEINYGKILTSYVKLEKEFTELLSSNVKLLKHSQEKEVGFTILHLDYTIALAYTEELQAVIDKMTERNAKYKKELADSEVQRQFAADKYLKAVEQYNDLKARY